MKRRTRIVALISLLVLAPIFAEFSSGYLTSSGNPAAMATELTLFIPLYGFIAVIIREVAVRRGLGWSGVLLLAAAFGCVQAGIADRSIFTLTGTGIEYWPEIMSPTWVPSAGVALGAALGWVLGHVITSIGAPIAVAGLLAPGSRGQRLVSVPVLVVMGFLWVLVSVLVHVEVGRTYRPVPSWSQYAVVAVVAGVFVVVALGPLGHPRRHTAVSTGRWWGLVLAAGIGATAMLAADLASMSWVAAGVCALVTLGGGVALARLARHRWHPGLPAAAALGAMLMRAVEAFGTLEAAGVSAGAQLAHHVGFLTLVVALAVVLLVRVVRHPAGVASPW